MIKKYIEKLVESKDHEDAMQNVFYGDKGIDAAFQQGKISWKEHELLFSMIEKMA